MAHEFKYGLSLILRTLASAAADSIQNAEFDDNLLFLFNLASSVSAAALVLVQKAINKRLAEMDSPQRIEISICRGAGNNTLYTATIVDMTRKCVTRSIRLTRLCMATST
jgi:hypothetical protein